MYDFTYTYFVIFNENQLPTVLTTRKSIILQVNDNIIDVLYFGYVCVGLNVGRWAR